MRKIVLVLGLTSMLFGMGAETIESLSICKNSKMSYLVTVSNNDTEGRAIWIDDYNLLIGDFEGIMLPIVGKNTFKSRVELERWMKPHYGKVSCSPISYEEVQAEMDKQADEYQKLFK